MSWTLGELADFCGGKLRGDGATPVSGVSADTRSLERGQLFVAIRGQRFDGHDYVSDALAKGAAGALISRECENSGSAILVDDTVRALGDLAARHRQSFSGPVVAITGSNGKTTTKEMCAGILGASGLRVCRSRGNLNNHIGLPLSLLTLELDDDALLVEMGMNHEGEIAQLATIASPTVGAVTNIAPAHLGPLGSLEAIARAKGELFEHIRPGGTAVVNADDSHCVKQSKRFPGRTLHFGRHPSADFRALSVAATDEGESFDLETGTGRARIQLYAPGEHLVEDALCAATAAAATGLLGPRPMQAIRTGLAAFEAVEGRLTLRRAPGEVTLLDDTYNANPQSVAAALSTLATHGRRGRTIAVLGDMLELGSAAEALHADVGRAVAERAIDVLVAVGTLSAHTAGSAAEAGVGETLRVQDANGAAQCVAKIVRAGDTVLVKGSRGMRMERVVAALMEPV